MKKILKLGIFISLITMAITSCTTGFDELRNNPNDPGLDAAKPDLLLTQAIESMTDRVHEIFLGHEVGECWAQHMAKVQYTDEDRYISRTSTANFAWASFYGASGNDINLLLEITARETSKNDNYQGVGLVIRSYILSVLTDLFGPIPYTEAWKGSAEPAILLPKYDTQETVYRGIIASLKTANDLLKVDGDEIEGDILFGNDILKWKKFANSLRLRLLLRMSAKDEAFVTTEMTAIMGDADKYPIFESTADNASLQYLGSAPNNNPINENRKTRDDHRVSKTLTDLMWNSIPSGAAEPDYRALAYCAVSDAGTIEGIPNGLTSADAAAYLGGGLKNTSPIGPSFVEADAPGDLMTYAELQFILAEAAHKSYIGGGEAKAEEYYNAGITASYMRYDDAMQQGLLDYYGIPLGSYTAADLVGWFLPDGGYAYNSADADRLIGTQKWVAMFGQGLQSWFEWRRTGFPTLVVGPAAMNDGKVPVRLAYPTDENARNSVNLKDGITKLGGADNMQTKVWWDVEDNF